jgi:hypothetical protein
MTLNSILASKIVFGEVDEEWPFGELVNEDNDQVSIDLGDEVPFVDSLGRVLRQKDYKADGQIWQVHKGDADPFPSRPHAHCVGGKHRYIGWKLHLGTRALFNGPKFTNLYMHKKPFSKLIQLIQPKFPSIKFPLEDL